MKMEETVKGEDLRHEEGDLLMVTKEGGKYAVHIVFQDKICRPSLIRGTKKRDERLWKELGKCTNYTNYSRQVKDLGYKVCGHCVKRLGKEEFKQD